MSHIADNRKTALAKIKNSVKWLMQKRVWTDPNKREFEIDCIRANLRVLVRGGSRE